MEGGTIQKSAEQLLLRPLLDLRRSGGDKISIALNTKIVKHEPPRSPPSPSSVPTWMPPRSSSSSPLTNRTPQVAAFAQFGSDLDAATQQQLLRGSVLMELLKQKLFVPMPTPEMVLSLFSGSEGYLDKVPLKRIQEFEAAWIAYMKTNHKQVIDDITATGALSKENAEGLHTAMAGFLSETDFEVAKAA